MGCICFILFEVMHICQLRRNTCKVSCCKFLVYIYEHTVHLYLRVSGEICTLYYFYSNLSTNTEFRDIARYSKYRLNKLG